MFLSIDPYMRAYVYRLEKGSTMIGSQVAKWVLSESFMNLFYFINKML